MVQQTPAARRWSTLIDEQEASGQTVRAFAATRGVNAQTLSWWRCRLGRSKTQRPPKPTPKPVAFDEVSVAATVAHDVDGTVVIGLENLDAHIVVDHATDLDLLRRVLEATC